MISLNQIKQIHTLLPLQVKNDPELKGDTVEQFTMDPDRRSVATMTHGEANELIVQLGGKPEESKEVDWASYAKFDKDNKQHMYMLSLCYNIGWVRFDDKLQRNVADLSQLGAWLFKYGYLNKPLLQYSKTELPKLVTQLQNVLK